MRLGRMDLIEVYESGFEDLVFCLKPTALMKCLAGWMG